MIVTAVVECKWCGASLIIDRAQTTRSFHIAFNKFKRIHDWDCETQGKIKEKIDKAKTTTANAIQKMMTNN